jgi:hypothetical protein
MDIPNWINFLNNPQDVATVVGALGALGLILRKLASGVEKAIEVIRSNDMKHLDAKLDDLGVAMAENTRVTKETSAKIDRHLEWHVHSHPPQS